jgi:hypothetical protein
VHPECYIVRVLAIARTLCEEVLHLSTLEALDWRNQVVLVGPNRFFGLFRPGPIRDLTAYPTTFYGPDPDQQEQVLVGRIIVPEANAHGQLGIVPADPSAAEVIAAWLPVHYYFVYSLARLSDSIQTSGEPLDFGGMTALQRLPQLAQDTTGRFTLLVPQDDDTVWQIENVDGRPRCARKVVTGKAYAAALTAVMAALFAEQPLLDELDRLVMV